MTRGLAGSKDGADSAELPPDTRNRDPVRDLSARLGQLADSHPSSAGYVSDRNRPNGPASSPDRHQRDSPGEARPDADYPAADDIQLTADRRVHILAGDETGGGHRHGTGRPGKTEFPAGWGDDRIIGAVLAIARNPDHAPTHQNWNDRWRFSGKDNGVHIVAVAESDGRVWTAWPEQGSPGVSKNPAAQNSTEDS